MGTVETTSRLNVVTFGARNSASGGSAFDNTAAVQAAVDHIQATGAENYKSLFFPPGTWRFAGQVDVFEGLVIEGTGDDCILQIGDEAPSADHTLFNAASGVSFAMENLRFQGPTDANGQTIYAAFVTGSGATLEIYNVSKTGTCALGIGVNARLNQDFTRDLDTASGSTTEFDTESDKQWTVSGADRPLTVGDLTVSGDITAASAALSVASLSATGNISGVDITGTGDISGVDITGTGDISGVDITGTGDISAAGGFLQRETVFSTETGSTTATLIRDKTDGVADVDADGWIVCTSAGSVRAFAAWFDANAGSGDADFWVQKSTDGGSTFNDFWGTNAAPLVNLTDGTQVGTATVAKDTNTFEAGDILRIRKESLGLGGPTVMWATLVFES